MLNVRGRVVDADAGTESSMAENTIRQAMQRCSLDEFLAQKEAASAEFFNGKEPWLDGNMVLSS